MIRWISVDLPHLLPGQISRYKFEKTVWTFPVQRVIGSRWYRLKGIHMAAVLLDVPTIAAVKSALAPRYLDIKSSHLSEALAWALGFKTNRSLKAALEKTDGIPRIAVLGGDRLVARLKELGYPQQPDPNFDGEIGKQFAADSAEITYPDEVLRQLGEEQADLYYFCVTLQSSGIRLPGYLSLPSIDSRLAQANLITQDGFVRISVPDYMRVTKALEPLEEESPQPPAQAPDDYVGVVSFRADAPDDVDALFDILRTRFPGAWRRTDSASEDGVELEIFRPLSILSLHAQMREVLDGHIMVETLRALPLHLNSLERRYSDARPRDWASLDDEDLVDDGDEEAGAPALR